jgi:protein-arginine kinase activator protein McsA
LNNSKYYTIIKEIKTNIAKNGVTTDIVENLKTLRKIVVDESQPLLAKTLRLIYQHIERNGTFNVAIPEDEPIEDAEVEIEVKETEIDPVESLDYLLSNLLEPENKTNVADIRDYVAKLKEIAGEDW